MSSTWRVPPSFAASWQACSIVVGWSLPCQSGISFGTSSSRPSTLILIFSTGGDPAGAGFDSVGGAADIDERFVVVDLFCGLAFLGFPDCNGEFVGTRFVFHKFGDVIVLQVKLPLTDVSTMLPA